MLAADHPETLRRFHSELDVVPPIAASVSRVVGPTVERGELVSFGQEGLLGAARSFEPEREVPFRKWAGVRVRGAMYDGIRKYSRLPRSVYAKVKALAAANFLAEAHDEQETGEGAIVGQKQADTRVHERLKGAATAMAAALFAARSIDDEALQVADRAPTPEERAAALEVADRLQKAVLERGDPEATLLVRMYWHGETLEVAGAALHLSRSWACRIHARAISGLAKTIAELAPHR